MVNKKTTPKTPPAASKASARKSKPSAPKATPKPSPSARGTSPRASPAKPTTLHPVHATPLYDDFMTRAAPWVGGALLVGGIAGYLAYRGTQSSDSALIAPITEAISSSFAPLSNYLARVEANVSNLTTRVDALSPSTSTTSTNGFVHSNQCITNLSTITNLTRANSNLTRVNARYQAAESNALVAAETARQKANAELNEKKQWNALLSAEPFANITFPLAYATINGGSVNIATEIVCSEALARTISAEKRFGYLADAIAGYYNPTNVAPNALESVAKEAGLPDTFASSLELGSTKATKYDALAQFAQAYTSSKTNAEPNQDIVYFFNSRNQLSALGSAKAVYSLRGRGIKK